MKTHAGPVGLSLIADVANKGAPPPPPSQLFLFLWLSGPLEYGVRITGAEINESPDPMITQRHKDHGWRKAQLFGWAKGEDAWEQLLAVIDRVMPGARELEPLKSQLRLTPGERRPLLVTVQGDAGEGG